MNHEQSLKSIFANPIGINNNFIVTVNEKEAILNPKEVNQSQTKDIFSDKWEEFDKYEKADELYKFQYDWFFSLYGFSNEVDLKNYLTDKSIIVDTGCGLGYKAKWLAELAPNATVIGIDISEACKIASRNYANISNLFFLQADIANTGLKENIVDFMLCDQVIMHTENPEKTFEHLAKCTKKEGEFGCYFYAKKALPREMIDDYFRTQTHNISNEEMWKFSTQLTELGKALSQLNIKFISPDIPLLGIKGGEYDIQRFIYWNFLKCFWRDEWGFELSMSTNYDWYAPSNAKRFSKEEVLTIVMDNYMHPIYFHQEEACYSGRFKKLNNA